MKRLLNTLFITTQGAYLFRKRQTVCVRIEGQTRLQIPVHTLNSIVCFGRVSVSPPLMHLCGRKRLSISFLSDRGRFFARVHGPVSGNILLRKEQFRRSDDKVASAELARAFIVAKISNARTVLQRGLRDHEEKVNRETLDHAARMMTLTIKQLRNSSSIETIRGCEGDAARIYFQALDQLITAQKADFQFTERSRRPPMDNMNALLSFVYTLLMNDTASALESVGLDPAAGFLHRDRPGRPSLALDMMEEFRAVMSDRLVLTLINRQQVKPSGFKKTETGAVIMNDATRKEVLSAYQKRKQEEIFHPYFGEKMALGLLLHAQAMLLSRHLRGDIDSYPPFLWR